MASASRLAAAARTYFWRQNVLEAAANREAEATGGRRQKIIRRLVGLETASSGFCLPIGSSSQNLFLEVECFGGRRQSGGRSHWRPPSEDNSEASWFENRLHRLLPPN